MINDLNRGRGLSGSNRRTRRQRTVSRARACPDTGLRLARNLSGAGDPHAIRIVYRTLAVRSLIVTEDQ